MAILVDPPQWPAHGTVWGHLISDAGLGELHDFAARAGIPARGFDHDHYDVPANRLGALQEQGAELVASQELTRRLIASGLRVRKRDRAPRRADALRQARQHWAECMPHHPDIGEHLLGLWTGPNRHYHDARHLLAVLTALDLLTDANVDRPLALAAWFHDAVYHGVPGDDEAASAALAEQVLEDAVGRVEAHEAARLVRVTEHHDPGAQDESGALLSDADLSILGSAPGHYHVYLRDVRFDYGHVSEPDFREGRRRVVGSLLAAETLFHTGRGRQQWELAARDNLSSEEELRTWPRLT